MQKYVQLNIVYNKTHSINISIFLITKGLYIRFWDCISEHQTEVTACYDKPGCEMINESMCERFDKLKVKCKYTCKECECKDNKDCNDVTQEMCEKMTDVFRKDCAKTCKVCGSERKKY